MKSKIITISLTSIIALASGYYLWDIANNKPKSSPNVSNFNKENHRPTPLMPKNKKNMANRYQIKTPKTKKNEWKEIGDYKHKEKIIKHFQRFRGRKKSTASVKTPPKIELKLGKVFEKKQKNKSFKIRELLVSIETPRGKKTFVALLNEDTGKVIQKQGRRITDPFRRIGNKLKIRK